MQTEIFPVPYTYMALKRFQSCLDLLMYLPKEEIPIYKTGGLDSLSERWSGLYRFVRVVSVQTWPPLTCIVENFFLLSKSQKLKVQLLEHGLIKIYINIYIAHYKITTFINSSPCATTIKNKQGFLH